MPFQFRIEYAALQVTGFALADIARHISPVPDAYNILPSMFHLIYSAVKRKMVILLAPVSNHPVNSIIDLIKPEFDLPDIRLAQQDIKDIRLNS